MAREIDVDALVAGVTDGDRAVIGQAITLVESALPAHRDAARELLDRLVRPAQATTRVGISGVPGVGKSTFIENLGGLLVGQGHRVGVLAVDPSSAKTHGSVLGDKTRMASLANDERAFIRPSPASGTLGGVARATAQSITVLEAAGFDTVLVETVGVGQSETTVASMVDTFLFLTLGRTGDQLQGIKRGIVETADVIAVNKADGDGAAAAQLAARELSGLMRMLTRDGEWTPPVVTCSGLTGDGVAQVWAGVLAHREFLGEVGIVARRAEQRWDLACALVNAALADRAARTLTADLRARVVAGELSPADAADLALAD